MLKHQNLDSPRGKKEKTAKSFPIVGIGASAGGLEALEQFVAEIPIESGIAFIIIQHQDPDHKGIMVELLQCRTALPVILIKDRMQVEPNCIYFIPPGHDLTLKHNILYLLPQSAPHGLHLPIDCFFRSLAQEKQQQSIGVILSGMGSDGTFGVLAIKDKGGAAFVQDPSTAKFDSMPLSAINSGLIDVVAHVHELPTKIINYIQHLSQLSIVKPLRYEKEVKLKDTEKSDIEKIVSILKVETGQDFSHYKKSTLYRRIERRMGLYQLSSINDYANYLKEHKQESTLLFKELLIGVTRFLRDPISWEQLKQEIVNLLLNSSVDGVLRAWVAGCSTGEEAYSLAIIFKEVLEELKPTKKTYRLQIFATDLDKDKIEKARKGLFPKNIISDLSEKLLCRYFKETESGYRINKEIRDMIIFAPQNIIMDPPFTKLDILTCRNLLIYLESESQKQLLILFHYSLNPNGILMLGSSETIGNATYLFAPLPDKTRLFRRRDSSRVLGNINIANSFSRLGSDLAKPISADIVTPNSPPNLKTLVENVLLQSYTPPAVLVTDQGDILYINGKTGKYLEPAVGKANLNIFSMARNGVKQALSETFERALRELYPITIKSVKIQSNNELETIDITLHPMIVQNKFTGMILITFTPVELVKEALTGNINSDETVIKTEIDAETETDRIATLVEELQYYQRTLQMTRDEMQTSQEELKSANEELQSTNEELQSTNEELTTSKEEMQSMNEELQTANSELQANVDEITRTSNDIHNLLNSADIAILFLDVSLRVRRFTSQVTSIIKLIGSDIGRQITDLASELNYPTFIEDIKDVLRTSIMKEIQISAYDNRWFNVRIKPYQTLENKIEGIVITFIDISTIKKLELELRNSEMYLKKLQLTPHE